MNVVRSSTIRALRFEAACGAFESSNGCLVTANQQIVIAPRSSLSGNVGLEIRDHDQVSEIRTVMSRDSASLCANFDSMWDGLDSFTGSLDSLFATHASALGAAARMTAVSGPLSYPPSFAASFRTVVTFRIVIAMPSARSSAPPEMVESLNRPRLPQ